ncbi:DUF6587 family protein [Dyella sp. KRB-257]|uniref:DUF6587 family protein n=1 Tax=Dyella sp. KRB-257 TaxID=3400915 RepID=UPI003C116728
MSAFAVVQTVVLAGVLAASAWVAFRKLMPATSKRLLARLCAALESPQRGPVAHRLARWLRPAEARAGACGSGDGCDACGGCGSAVPSSVQRQPLEFKSRSR